MQPTPYTQTTDFSQQEALNASGRSTVNTAALDAEFQAIAQTLDGTLDNLALIQRDDGKLEDQVVELHTLSRHVLNLIGGFTVRGAWAAATAYAVNDVVDNASSLYLCIVAHTSPGAFVASPNWLKFGYSSAEDGAVWAAQAQTSANNASTSATAAAGSATAAAGSATAAAASAAAANALAADVRYGTQVYAAAGGTADAITAIFSPAVTALTNGMILTVRAAAANATAAPTFSPNGLTAKAITKRGGAPLVAGDIAGAGHGLRLRYDLTLDAWELLNPSDQTLTAQTLTASMVGPSALINGRLDYSLSANTLICRLKTQSGGDPSATDPVLVAFRSATMTNGGHVVRVVTSALSITISSGSTLGTTSAQFSSVAVRLIDNAGTVEMAVDNLAGGNNLDESTLISTTAEGGAGAADSATTIYSATARTSVAWRLLGLIESTQTTAGIWAQTPSAVKTVSASGLQSIGYGQTWQNVSGSRTAGVTYYNTTGKPITLALHFTLQATPSSVTINGITIAQFNISSGAANVGVTYVVPPGGSYSVGFGWAAFYELR